MRGVLKRFAPSAGERVVVGAPLALITALSLAIADAGKVVAVTGSVCGSAIIYLFPATMWFATEARVPRPRAREAGARSTRPSAPPRPAHASPRAQRKAQAAGAKPKRVEAVINGMLMGMGVALGILGSYVSLRG